MLCVTETSRIHEGPPKKKRDAPAPTAAKDDVQSLEERLVCTYLMLPLLNVLVVFFFYESFMDQSCGMERNYM